MDLISKVRNIFMYYLILKSDPLWSCEILCLPVEKTKEHAVQLQEEQSLIKIK